MARARKSLEGRLKHRAKWLLGFLLLLWAVHILNELSNHSMNGWGIVPRSWRGLIGIPLSPFIHGSWQHLILNSIPFIALGGLVVARGASVFVELTAFVAVLGGAAVWLLADFFEETTKSHIGASGLIFGYFGFLVARGWYDRSILAVVVAVIVIVLYGGVIATGLLPTSNGVSWEGHLFGLLAGIMAAKGEKLPQ